MEGQKSMGERVEKVEDRVSKLEEGANRAHPIISMLKYLVIGAVGWFFGFKN